MTPGEKAAAFDALLNEFQGKARFVHMKRRTKEVKTGPYETVIVFEDYPVYEFVMRVDGHDDFAAAVLSLLPANNEERFCWPYHIEALIHRAYKEGAEAMRQSASGILWNYYKEGPEAAEDCDWYVWLGHGWDSNWQFRSRPRKQTKEVVLREAVCQNGDYFWLGWSNVPTVTHVGWLDEMPHKRVDGRLIVEVPV